MLKYNGKEFRNLEDQVGYLTDAFKSGKLIDELGIKVLGVFSDLTTAKETIRPPYEYGDAFEIGTQKPYNLYIYTRNIEDFFDFGPFPAPGPKGDLGPTPSISINASVTNTTGSPEAIVTKTGTDEAPIFNFTFKNIKGERGQTGMQGIQGPRGFTGATGPIGPRGNTGPKGDVGPAFKLLGDLTSTSQLPTPTSELQAQGAAYTIPNTEGIKHIWVIQGIDNLLWVDIGESGVQGPKGDTGTGINDLQSVQDIGAPVVTYDLTDGITINGTERYTYSTGQTDVNTEKKIPLIAGEGISIDTTSGADKIAIKTLNTNIKNGTGTGSLVQKTVSSSGTPYVNEASGSGSVAMGKKVKSKGNATFVIGQENEAIAGTSASFTSGRLNINRGSYNITGGENNANNNSWNLVIGKNNAVSDGRFGIVSGLDNVYTGPGDYNNTTVSMLGNNLYVQSGYMPTNGALLIGRYNRVQNNSGRLFIVGNGTSPNDRKNAFEVLEDGRAKVQSAPTESDDVVRKQELDKKLDEPSSIGDTGFVVLNANGKVSLTPTAALNSKLTAPTKPTEDSAVILSANGAVSTKPLSGLGGGTKLYKHEITIDVEQKHNYVFIFAYLNHDTVINTFDLLFENRDLLKGSTIRKMFQSPVENDMGILYDVQNNYGLIFINVVLGAGGSTSFDLTDGYSMTDTVTEL